MTKRIQWVDIAKCICILCVIFSHLESSSELFYNFINPFFLVTFFFCAGYCYSEKYDFRTFVYRKVRQLFIPWLVFSYGNIFLSHIKSFKQHIDFSDELFRNLLQIRGYDDKLWFIAAIFVAYIPFYYVIRYANKNKDKKNIILFILLGIYILRDLYFDFLPPTVFPWGSASLPWHIDYIPLMLFYMYLGYYYRNGLEELLDKYNALPTRVFLLLAYFISVYIIKLDNTLILIPYKILRHLVSILLIVFICKKIKINNYLSFVGKNTLIYFSIHNKFSTLIEYIMKYFNQNIYPILNVLYSNEFLSNIYAALLTIIISLVLIVPTILLNKYCPKLLGKEI